MKTCTRCGQPTPTDQASCVACGQPLTAYAAWQGTLGADQAGTQPQPQAGASWPSAEPQQASWPTSWPAADSGAHAGAPDASTQWAASAQPSEGQQQPAWAQAPASADPVEGVPSHLAVEGEIVHRVFPVVRSKRAMGWLEGQFTVTNRRILFRAKAKNTLGESTSYSEVAIEDVNGLVLEGRRGFSATSLVTFVTGALIGLVVLMMVGSAASFSSSLLGPSETPAWVTFLFVFWIGGAVGVFVIRMRTSELVLLVTPRGADHPYVGMSGRNWASDFFSGLLSPVALLLEAMGMFESQNAGNSATLPETERIYDELGALILSLQAAQTVD